MSNRSRLRITCLLFLATAICSTGCKKRVAAAPPTPPVQPAAAPPAPSITLRADQDSINRGQTATLRWEARNANSVRIDPEIGGVSNQGSRAISPASSVTYTAIATGPGGTAIGTVRITVLVPAAAAARVTPTSLTPRPDARVSIDQLFKQNVQTIYFDYDQSEIRPDQVSRLEANALWLRQNRAVKFRIEGNCDDRGSEEYNLALGERRASRVRDFLVRQGVDASRITPITYGEERPACREETEACYQRNRRAEFQATETNP